jgi:hypothetical protein
MKTRTLTLALCPLALAATLCACAAPEPSKDEQRASAQQTNAAQATSAAPAPSADAATGAQPQQAQAAATVKPPPEPRDVRAAVERVYKGAVAPDESAAAVGDFNGDDSEDLVVRARPAPGRLKELNDEVANWIITDPHTVRPPDPRDFDPHQGVQKLAPPASRPRIEPADALLVVVHGYKEQGWRNPEALQTFLLKNAAGTELRTEARAAAQAAARKGAPRLVGDVLHERLDGEQGFLYWTGATYGWFH